MLKSQPPGAPNAQSSAALKAEISDMLKAEPPPPDAIAVLDDSTRVDHPGHSPVLFAGGPGANRLPLISCLRDRRSSARQRLQSSSWGSGMAASAATPAPTSDLGDHRAHGARQQPGSRGSHPQREPGQSAHRRDAARSGDAADGRLLRGIRSSVFPKDDAIHELSAGADGYRDEASFSSSKTSTFAAPPSRGAPRGRCRPRAVGAPAAARPTGEARGTRGRRPAWIFRRGPTTARSTTSTEDTVNEAHHPSSSSRCCSARSPPSLRRRRRPPRPRK
jgi:hypothetical protein